jgi:hypothetical protein
MSEQLFTINLSGDEDGFISLQCPFCDERFKLTGRYGSSGIAW